jgi:uncharacterized protein YlxP (DUF503 family)
VGAFVCLVEIELHLGQSHDLKAKRKAVHSLKAQLRKRFGASVAEVDKHDKWQRATLLCALVGDHEVGERGSELARFVEARFPAGCSFERDLLSLADVRD